MKKLFFNIIIGSLVVVPQMAFAQQTLEQATDSIKQILVDARAGKPEAQNEVGAWYYRGRHVKQNYKEAAQWWAKAAAQGNARAIGNLGLCYQTGNGVEADSLKAMKLYTSSIKRGNVALFKQNMALAGKGNVFAQVYTAYCLQHGLGVKKDPAKAATYLETAASKGSVDAQRELALYLLNSKQPVKAYAWFKKAADKGSVPSIFYCGKMLIDGLGVKKDAQQGMIYILKAADAGFANAEYIASQAYYQGNGVTKSNTQGYNWLLKAALSGVSNAQYQLAQKMVIGDGCPVNYDRATYWFGRSIPAGHAVAFKKEFDKAEGTLYGTPYQAYLKGLKYYSQKDFEQALKQFKIVEKAGIVEGKTMTAVIMANKDYSKYNLKKGVKLLKEAAKTDPMAMYLLGAMYEAGKGVEADLVQAKSYLEQAAKAGNPEAMCYLGNMYYEGRGVDKSYDEAVRYYMMSEGQLTPDAAKHLAACYENGYGNLEKDTQKAEELLKNSYKNTTEAVLKLVPMN
ncbi:tetratricopeptide repeat protein [Muribaculum caecicola]|uniref:Sel1 repeat family protein n=1 Tax=Muribaculum caecicola TaxID=3038144 RepID=A0AC61S7H7_9BACT|nr:tetratricopeptide repeat protein [Muribaculum caecicola]THG54480.1 sel1 repeat family protein [Muribaculum caecicola]